MDSWNRFDFLVTVGSVIDVIVHFTVGDRDVAEVLIILRIFRIFRFVRCAISYTLNIL